jgi:hypothetical protein
MPVNKYIDSGQQVLIYPGAFWPQLLYATYNVPITWTNLSGRPERVIFSGIPVSSPVIPEGGQWVWASRTAGALIYKAPSGFRASLVLAPSTPITVP